MSVPPGTESQRSGEAAPTEASYGAHASCFDFSPLTCYNGDKKFSPKEPEQMPRVLFMKHFISLILQLSLLLLICEAGAYAQAPPGNAEVYLTAKDTPHRLTPRGAVPFRPMAQPEESSTTIIVDPARTFQTIEGIGGALTDAAAETFFKLPSERQDEVIRAYYDPIRGIGYSLGRTHIHSCDFSSGSYIYTEPGDRELKTFSIAHDLNYRVPLIKRALAAEPKLKLFASPWSPPAWMKTNDDMLHGGKLIDRHAERWARYYVKFVEAYAAQGIPMWGLTVQNEPMATQKWESCLFTAEEERDFVRDNLGPALSAANLGHLKLMIWDHNRTLLYQRASTVYEDPEASKYVWGTAYHWYVGTNPSVAGLVHDAFPDKAIFFSEGCNFPFSWHTFNDWKWGENYGRSMIGDFNNWACGWTDWNILLDERGGPNHVGNFCFAPIHADTRKGTLHYMNSYYYIGHFSKFVRPGARRIACSSTAEEILATAFVNQDGRIVTVVMNPTDKDAEVNLWMRSATGKKSGQALRTPMPRHSIATVTWKTGTAYGGSAGGIR
jgi:glucosylceramidase